MLCIVNFDIQKYTWCKMSTVSICSLLPIVSISKLFVFWGMLPVEALQAMLCYHHLFVVIVIFARNISFRLTNGGTPNRVWWSVSPQYNQSSQLPDSHSTVNLIKHPLHVNNCFIMVWDTVSAMSLRNFKHLDYPSLIAQHSECSSSVNQTVSRTRTLYSTQAR